MATPEQNPEVSESVRKDIRLIWEFIEYEMEHEGTDRQLILEGVQEMLTDLVSTGLVQTSYYVSRYSSATQEEVDEAVEAIEEATRN